MKREYACCPEIVKRSAGWRKGAILVDRIAERISEVGIVPVIKLKHPERDAVNLGKSLCKGGIPIGEVTFRAEGADTALRLMHAALPEMLLGAGTVTTKEQIDRAVDAGAEFIVCPGFDEELVQYAQERNVPIFPGASSASDYHKALKYDLKVLKFFPAEQLGGIPMIKALSGPFPMFKIMPTGGISLKNLGEYMASPLIAACGGSYMVKDKLIEEGAWEEITRLCEESVKIIREARRGTV